MSEDFWIGDSIQIISTGAKGKYEGLDSSGKVKVNIEGVVHLVDEKNIQLSVDHEIDDSNDPWPEENNEVDILQGLEFNDELDLHIETLALDRVNDTPIQIKNHQLIKCKEYVETAIKLRMPSVKIIHGKGTGALKKEVLNLLSGFPEIFIMQDIHQGGATECIFNYRKQ